MDIFSALNKLNLDFFFAVNLYAASISLVGAIVATNKMKYHWKFRHLKKIFGIKDGETVFLVCSELENPESRQWVEDREFIYTLKYGDVDALFEVIATFLRLYPKIDLRILSSGEAETIQLDFASHIVLIGGPDYNKMVRRVFALNGCRYGYKSPVLGSAEHDNEIRLLDKVSGESYFFDTHDKDYGYFEKIKNPADPSKSIILVGGCHTIGVTGAAKALSVFSKGNRDVSSIVYNNAKTINTAIKRRDEYSTEVSPKFSLSMVPAFKPPCAKRSRQKNFAGVWLKRGKA